MGRMLDGLASAQGHEVIARIDQTSDPGWEELSSADVAIEFSGPAWAPDNLVRLAALQLPTVCGSTGWEHAWSRVEDAYRDAGCSLIVGSNFSVGVNLLFLLNRKLAAWMNRLPAYDVAIEEQHHAQKADAPSGSAHSLAAEILAVLDRKTSLVPASELAIRPPKPEELTIGYIRTGGIHGTHRVLYTSLVDDIVLSHTAHSREGFASGALLAADWLLKHPGIHRFEGIFETLLSND